MKKFFAILVSLALVLSLVACGGNTTAQTEVAAEKTTSEGFKVGIVLIGDENEGYTFSHIDGIRNAVKALGLDEKSTVTYKYNIGESAAVLDACEDLAEHGCTLIITNSYGHQSFTEQAAMEYPNLEFVAMTGDTAKSSGLPNLHNAFTKIYQGRYLGGIVAGLKIKELVDAGKLSDKNYDADGNVKMGYVGAYPYAEVVSGYTAFYLGVKSVFEKVVMDVQYTNSWGDMMAEREAATALVNDGCVIIGQHADTTGAPSAVEELLNAGNVCYSVGYNVDMQAAAPNAALISATNNWTNYYKHIIEAVMNGEKIETDWAEGFETDSVRMTEVSKNCTAGAKKAIDDAVAKMINGTLHVFDNTKFTVNGEKVEHAFATDTDGDFTNDADEAMFDGYYHESYFKSAPSFSLRIDGIKELN